MESMYRSVAQFQKMLAGVKKKNLTLDHVKETPEAATHSVR